MNNKLAQFRQECPKTTLSLTQKTQLTSQEGPLCPQLPLRLHRKSCGEDDVIKADMFQLSVIVYFNKLLASLHLQAAPNYGVLQSDTQLEQMHSPTVVHEGIERICLSF